MRLKQRETMQVQSVRTIQFRAIRISHSEAKRDLCVKNGHIRQSGLVFSARRQLVVVYQFGLKYSSLLFHKGHQNGDI